MNGQELATWAFIIFGIIGAFWVYEQYNQRRIDKLWKRVDEKYDLCVEQKIYDSDKAHNKEMADEKHSRLMEFFGDKFKNLETKIDTLNKIVVEKLK